MTGASVVRIRSVVSVVSPTPASTEVSGVSRTPTSIVVSGVSRTPASIVVSGFSRTIAILVVLAMAAPLLAHHSAAVAYDLDRYITLQGVVTEVKWENPHTWIYLDVTEGGKVVPWGFEGAVPNQLYRRGVTPTILKPGMPITIKGHPARDTSRRFGEVHEIVLQDGRSFVIGASGTGPRTATPKP